MTGSNPSRLRNMASVGPATPQPMMMTLVICVFEAFSSHASAYRSEVGEWRGKTVLLMLEDTYFFGGGSKDGEGRTGSSIKGLSSLGPDIGCFEALRCNDGGGSGPQVSAEARLYSPGQSR